VLDQVDFEVRHGEIHGLLGANGAGKSTLCKIFAGLQRPTDGSMLLQGTRYHPTNKSAAEKAGVGIVQQELNLIPTLSVAENLFLSHLPQLLGILRYSQLHRDARRLLDQFGLHHIDTRAPVGALGIGHQQMVEIAAVLHRRCQLLILDEPTAALTPAESTRLFTWLDKLRNQRVAIIYVSHRLDEVKKITDRITVLRDGRYVCSASTTGVTQTQMIEWMTSETSRSTDAHPFRSFRQPIASLQAHKITRPPISDVSFTVHRGERFGIFGLVGSGRTELLRTIFGADIATGGHIVIGGDGSPQRFQAPHQATRAGLAMITEDRKHDGLLIDHSIRTNVTINTLTTHFAKRGVIQQQLESEATARQCSLLDTRYNSIEQLTRTLSGGNQQKVVVAKWLLKNARVYLCDEPSRGIDVAARCRIYRLFETLAEQGCAMIIASSDLEELLENCDRIGVMSAGHLVQIFDRDTWSDQLIMQAAFAGYRAAAHEALS
jgi:ribose transport system ATP-binding protein